MTIEKTFQGIRISTMYKNQYVTMHYIGYTKEEALKELREHLKTL